MAHSDLAELARSLASGVFLVAGVLTLALWRLSGDVRDGRRGIAVIVLGASFPAAAAIGPLLHEPAPFTQVAPSTRSVFLVPVVALLLTGADSRRRWSERTALRPIPLHHVVVIGWAVGSVLGVALYARHTLEPQALAVAWRLICVLCLCAWVLLAVRAAADARAVGRTTERTLVPAYGLMALAELFRLASISGIHHVVGTAPGIQLTAAALVLVAVVRDLLTAHRHEADNAADLLQTVARLQTSLAEIEVAERERLHDARSAVVGVLGASELLAASAPDVDAERLRRLITAELRRVQIVLDKRVVEPVVEFDIAEALSPVVLSHQLHGEPVLSAVRPVRVVGRPRATATVLDNLLRNATVHAPGARVTVSTRVVGDSVEVLVEDDGPGILPDDRARVLQPGQRGSSSVGDGEGLGLHSCQSTVRGQGGSLRLDASPAGGTRVTFTVPLAGEARVIQLDPEAPTLARGA